MNMISAVFTAMEKQDKNSFTLNELDRLESAIKKFEEKNGSLAELEHIVEIEEKK